MAGELLSFGIQKLWYLLSQEHELFQGVESQVSGLQRDLNWLSSFLKDADAKKHTTAVVRNVVEEIHEIVYDAEDIIETYLLKERLGKTSGINMSIRRLACIIPDRRKNSLDIGGIRTRISDVIRDMQSFGVQQAIADGGYMQPLGDRQKAMRQTFPMDYESDFVGLEENVNKLVGYFVEKDDVQVVSITGMGGLGKTTLARQVFNHEMVKNKFNRLAWVCVSQEFTRISVWQTILQNLTSKEKKDEILKMKEADLQDELFRLLETSKSLIVLDDIWKDEDWDLIKPIFPPDKGWKVLLTSRNESVAMREDAKYVNFKPECLTIPDSWILFKRIAFRRKDASESKVDEEMEEMGKQMIKHCGGLPLAVKVLGGLLAEQHTLSEWKRVYERNISSVYHILYLSFEELPSYLKHCFLYLAHFPEDHKINLEDLSYYWAAEGIPRPRGYDGATIREVVDGYIEELVKRNMLISQRDAITSRFKTCQLHDMMREVCLRKAEEENFVDIVGSANSQSPCKSRRIVIHEIDESYDTKGMMKNPKLRSLLYIRNPSARGWMASDILFRRLQLLRALDLSEAKFKGGKLPSSIGKLIHLRYLSLFEAEVTHLPSSMRNLKQLLYLNLRVSSSSPIYMPNNVLNEMGELTYLYLPLLINNKVKMELVNLVKLETLESFSTKHSSLRDLQRMTRLETLSILFNGGCARETLSSSLKELRRLENLTIQGFTNDEEGIVLDCVHLKRLVVGVYMPRLPDEQHFPSHLTFLSLMNCRLEEDPMPILEKLLQLKEIVLGERSFCGRRMVCSGGGFPQLQKLEFYRLEEWEEWIVEEGSMPLLHTLEINHCKKLKELPDGLRFITSLKEMKIYEAPLEFKEKLSRGGEDFYKVQHIPLLKI